MNFKKFIIIPILIGVLAAILQICDQLITLTEFFSTWKGFAWIAFQSWAMYFISGCNITGGIKALIGYFLGCVVSIIIIMFGSAIVDLTGFFAFPIAIFIIVIPVICLEKVKWLDYVPAIFIGSGAFFAIMNYVPNVTFCTATIVEMTYALLGLAFGWITIILRTRYEACVAKKCSKE